MNIITVLRHIVYSQVDGQDLLLDLYLPEQETHPRPVILWVHGGAFRKGDKETPPVMQLVDQGYAVASLNYRLSQQAIFPAQIHDCKAAVRWLRANVDIYKLDADRIGAWGASAGGHLVALLGTSAGVPELEGAGGNPAYSSRVQAVCDWYGPTDFLRLNDFPGSMDHDAADSPESELIGGPIQDNQDMVAQANPITYITPEAPPFLIMHGELDPLIPVNQSERLHEALQKAGVDSTLVILNGLGHGFQGDEEQWGQTLQQVQDFFDQHLKSEAEVTRPIAEDTNLQVNRWGHPFETGPVGLKYVTFTSQTIGEAYGYFLYLPPDYDTQRERRYPVLYWLHGRNGDPSQIFPVAERLNTAIREGRVPAMIAIGVNGLRQSMYCDDKRGAFPVETVIVKDLIAHVDETYRTIPQREYRAVEGFSMGGFGAAHLGFKYPDLFGLVSILGAAMHNEAALHDFRPEIFEVVFGGNLTYCRANVPWTLAEQNADRIRGRTIIRLYVGEHDQMLLRTNIRYHQLLEHLNIEHQFGIVENAGHSVAEVYDNLVDGPFAFYAEAFSAVPG